MKCSIVIPVFNKWFYTSLCMMSLEKTLAGRADVETVIVDNASTDATPRSLAQLGPPYRVLTNEENLGFARACNQGARASTGDYLLFLNNDTVCCDGWLDPMFETIEQRADVGVVGSKLLYADNRIQHAGVVIADDLTPRHMYCLFPGDYGPANVDREYQAVTGACLLLSRELFEDIGGFDERYLNSFEDIDLCFRVRRHGLKVMYCANSVLYHFESISEGRHKHDEANTQLYLERWSGFVKPDQRERYLAEGFTDVPSVPGLTAAELGAQVSDQRRVIATLERSLTLASKQLETLAEKSHHDGYVLRSPSGAESGAGQIAAWSAIPAVVEAGSHAHVTLACYALEARGLNLGDWRIAYRWLDEALHPLTPDVVVPVAGRLGAGGINSLELDVVVPTRLGKMSIQWVASSTATPFLIGASRKDMRVLCTVQVSIVPAHGAEYSATVPSEMFAGGRVKVLASVKNTGGRAWLENGNHALSYHWYEANGVVPVVWEGIRTVLTDRVRTGDSIAMEATVKVPPFPGDYVLALDMVEERVAWFSRVGVPEHKSRVTVVPAVRQAKNLGAAHDSSVTAVALSAPEFTPRRQLASAGIALVNTKERRDAEVTESVDAMHSLIAYTPQREQNRARLPLEPDVVALIEAKEQRIAELTGSAEALQALRTMTRQQEQDLVALIEAKEQRIAELTESVDTLQALRTVTRQQEQEIARLVSYAAALEGNLRMLQIRKVLRFVEALARWRRKLRR